MFSFINAKDNQEKLVNVVLTTTMEYFIGLSSLDNIFYEKELMT